MSPIDKKKQLIRDFERNKSIALDFAKKTDVILSNFEQNKVIAIDFDEKLKNAATIQKLEELKSFLSGLIISYQDSQNLANGIVDADLRDIENKLSEIDALVNTKVSSSEFSRLQSDVSTVIQNNSNSIAKLVSKAELDKKLNSLDYLTSNSIIDGGIIV